MYRLQAKPDCSLIGLCMHWGFYLTSALDTSYLGSSDLHDCLRRALGGTYGWVEHVSFKDGYRALVERNISIARRHFSAILYARLLVFKRFIQQALSQGLKHEHKQRWLEFQLQPGLIDPEPFGTLYATLVRAFVEERVLSDSIAQILEEITEIWDFTTAEHPIYFVLDEANYAVHSHKFSFLTDTGARYPILKVMLQTWRQHLKHLPVSFIVAGTQIPSESFSEEEWSDFRWCSDTGSFNEADLQRQYIRRFLPQELSVSSSGEELMVRAWRWLRDRHRFTASFMAVLLEGGFESPHHLLTSYVETISDGYRPQDGAEFIAAEKPTYNNKFQGLNFEVLENDRGLRSAVHHGLLHTLCFSEGPTGLSLVKLVTWTQGYFVDGGMSEIAFDEPIALISAAQDFSGAESRSISGIDFFLRHVIRQDIYHRYYFAALSLALAFDENRRVWRFFSLSLPPNLGRRRGDFAKALQVVERLVTGGRFWVILEVVFESTQRELSAAEVQDTFQAISPTTLLGDSSADTAETANLLKSLENPCPGLGPFNVLRAILPFSGNIDINHPDFAHSEEPIAVLNVQALKPCVEAIPQPELVEHIVAMVTGLPKKHLDDYFGLRHRPATTKASRSKLPKAPQPRSAPRARKPSKKTPAASKGRKGKRPARRTKSTIPSPDMEQTAGPSMTLKPKSIAVSDPIDTPAETSKARRGKRQPARMEVVEAVSTTSSRGRKRKQVSPITSTFPPTTPQPDNVEPVQSKTPRYHTRSVTKRLGK
ncbi:hypothetical protein MPER_12981 [Moniliophthora perniciosa FA553]|nr:hypothetical protein MPER_12981 [Moniliophthora perniciosa FA553]